MGQGKGCCFDACSRGDKKQLIITYGSIAYTIHVGEGEDDIEVGAKK